MRYQSVDRTAAQGKLINASTSHRVTIFTLLLFQVTTVDKFQGQQNDYIILSLVRTKAVGHLRDIRRLVVAMSRARLGLYIFGRIALFKNCFELTPAFHQVIHFFAEIIRLEYVNVCWFLLYFSANDEAVEIAYSSWGDVSEQETDKCAVPRSSLYYGRYVADDLLCLWILYA